MQSPFRNHPFTLLCLESREHLYRGNNKIRHLPILNKFLLWVVDQDVHQFPEPFESIFKEKFMRLISLKSIGLVGLLIFWLKAINEELIHIDNFPILKNSEKKLRKSSLTELYIAFKNPTFIMSGPGALVEFIEDKTSSISWRVLNGATSSSMLSWVNLESSPLCNLNSAASTYFPIKLLKYKRITALILTRLTIKTLLTRNALMLFLFLLELMTLWKNFVFFSLGAANSFSPFDKTKLI